MHGHGTHSVFRGQMRQEIQTFAAPSKSQLFHVTGSRVLRLVKESDLASRLDNPHRSGDGLCDPHPATDRCIIEQAEQRRTNPTSLDKVRLH